MDLQTFIRKVVELGRPGAGASLLLILAAVGITLLIRRRLDGRVENGQPVNWGHLAISFLSTLLLIISGVWSGWAKYNDYIQADPLKAWIVAAGFVACGMVVAVVLQSYAVMAKQEKGLSRAVAVLAMIGFSLFWLAISPLQNARFLCAQTAVRTEIEQRFAELDHYSTPIIAGYHRFRSKYIPMLQTIHESLVKMADEQAKTELGGCGPICNQFHHYVDLLQPSVDRLYLAFDPDDPAKDYRSRVNKMRSGITELINSNEYGPEDLRSMFYDKASTWVTLLEDAGNQDAPQATLNRALQYLDDMLQFLHTYKQRRRSGDGTVAQKAVNRALSELEPLIGDLQLAFTGNEAGKESMVVLMSAKSGFNLADIAAIRMTPALLRKHVSNVWPEALLAFFIDLAALGFIFVPMLVTFLRGSEAQRIRDRIQRQQLVIRRVRSRLFHLAAPISRLEREKERIEQDNRDTSWSEKLARSLTRIDTEIDQQVTSLKARQTTMEEEQEKKLITLAATEGKELGQATSPADELVTRGRFEIYRENIRKKYQPLLEKIGKDLNQLEEQRRTLHAKARKKHDERLRQAANEKEAALQAVSVKLARLQKKKERFEGQLADAEQKIEEYQQRLDFNGVQFI